VTDFGTRRRSFLKAFPLSCGVGQACPKALMRGLLDVPFHSCPPKTAEKSLEVFDVSDEENVREMSRYFESRIDDLNKGYCEDEPLDPLAVDVYEVVKIELSWGGPGDGFLLYRDKETKEILYGYYYFTDWFFYQEQKLSEDEVQLVYDYFCIA